MTGLFSGFYEGGAHAGHFENVNLLSFADNKNEEYTLFPSVTLFGISDEFEEPWVRDIAAAKATVWKSLSLFF